MSWKAYRRQRLEKELPVVPCAAEEFPAEVAARLEALAAPLRDEGFVHALDCGPRDTTATVLNHCRVFSHPAESIRAWVMDFETEHRITTMLELATRFPDGTIIGTTNPSTPSIFDRPPWIQSEAMPEASVESMLASHRGRVAQVAGSPAPPWDGDPLTTAHRENEAILAYQAERGIVAAKAGGYGFTGRGAIRSVHRVANAEPTD